MFGDRVGDGAPGHSRVGNAHARHPGRDSLEPRLDALDAGRRRRRLPQADERAVLRVRDAGAGHVHERRDRNRRGAVQVVVRDGRLRRGHGHRRPRLPTLRRAFAATRAGRGPEGVRVGRTEPCRAVHESRRASRRGRTAIATARRDVCGRPRSCGERRGRARISRYFADHYAGAAAGDPRREPAGVGQRRRRWALWTLRARRRHRRSRRRDPRGIARPRRTTSSTGRPRAATGTSLRNERLHLGIERRGRQLRPAAARRQRDAAGSAVP